METPARAEGRTERRQAAGMRQAILLSSAGHLLALAACLLLGSGAPTASIPGAVDVVLVAATGPGGAEFLGAPAPAAPAPERLRAEPARNAKRLPAPDRFARRNTGSPPRREERLPDSTASIPPRRSAAPARPDDFPFRTGSAWEEGFAAKASPPEAGPPPVEGRPAGAAPAESADVPAEAVRDEGPPAPADAGAPRGASAGVRGSDGGHTGTAASGAASAAAATLRDGQGGGGAGGGDGGVAARLRDAIQSMIVYPDEAVRRGLEGEVLLRIRIGKGGSPGEIRVAKSSGARILDEAARRGVVRAAPLPSAPGWVEVPVRFSLQRPGGEGP